MRRVVKLGGSLLMRADLRVAMQAWIDAQDEAETLVLVGGGRLVDVIRQLDAAQKLNSTDVHWICVELLQSTFEIARSWFDWTAIDNADELNDAVRTGFSIGAPTLVAVRAFYDRQSGGILPESWQTTSDALAALLAIRSAADELVLLKSCEVDSAATIAELSREGIVDGALPAISRHISKIRVERLRRDFE